uniref:Uncharacterized protein n=1 Tax=Salix viminalis TaxID=40686 RepID=A0A6N2K0T2_SALVM
MIRKQQALLIELEALQKALREGTAPQISSRPPARPLAIQSYASNACQVMLVSFNEMSDVWLTRPCQ